MPPDRPNLPVPDELAHVRDEIRSLTAREEELRRLLLSNPDLREGASFLAEIKTTQQRRCDLKEMRAHHPDIVEQFTHAIELTRIELTGITEDGELVSRRKLRTV
jgi:hypothetical protein